MSTITLTILFFLFLCLSTATPTTRTSEYEYFYEEVPATAPSTVHPPSSTQPMSSAKQPHVGGPSSSVTLSDGTAVSSSGDNSVSAAGNTEEGAASANSEEGSVLAIGGPGFGAGFAGLLGSMGGLAIATPAS